MKAKREFREKIFTLSEFVTTRFEALVKPPSGHLFSYYDEPNANNLNEHIEFRLWQELPKKREKTVVNWFAD